MSDTDDTTADGQESQPSASHSSSLQWSPLCRHFKFQEIQLATDNFDESLIVGQGGFGKVYRGTIYDGSTPVDAAIKRLDFSSGQGAPEFWAEVEMLSKLRHCHLVSLFGYCNYGKEMILVYEYMPNGTLADHLHKLGTPLSWPQRLNICIGAARGLHYLHTGTGIESGVIHRDVKSSNILLNESWAAEISDFGLSRIAPTNQTVTGVSTLVKGTFGYFDPDYYCTGRLTRKSDVYAFGVVLLEVLCRKRAIDESLGEDQPNLARWAQESIKEGNLKHIIDSDIKGEISPKCLKEFVRIVERCLISNPKQRSTMAEVVVGLESLLSVQEKIYSSLQAAGRTIFSRIVDKFSSPSKAENSVSAEGKRIQALKELKHAGIKEVKFGDLKRATKNFSQHLMLRRDCYGQVYLGRVDNEMFGHSMFVVKRFNEGKVEAWAMEANLLVRLSHPNIISLLGYYCTIHEYLLVYEYFPYGSLDHFLHKETADHIDEPFSWGTRLTIMIGVARGLACLHSFGFIHGGVKSSAILLDQDFHAKLFNFENARVCTDIKETITSTQPFDDSFGYLRTDRLSEKNDIYSFGVLLLETLTGTKLPFWETREKTFLVEKSKLKIIMDPLLEGNYPLRGAFKCVALAFGCTARAPDYRPSSEEVLRSLEKIYAAHSVGTCNSKESSTESDTEAGTDTDTVCTVSVASAHYDTDWGDDTESGIDIEADTHTDIEGVSVAAHYDTDWSDDGESSLTDESTDWSDYWREYTKTILESRD